MRLPFISRRRHETAVDFLAAVHRVNLDEERAARVKAEHDLAAEQAKLRRAVAYVGQAEGRRDADGARLARALRAVARLRTEAAVQRRVNHRLANQLLDATGYQGEPLLPAAREALGITTTEVKK
ncbi:hypothetical protein ACH44C_34485 [Streptomyces purpureus]|uniref:hypothetical protein n=1 Tax=Streptomyces purpureus TaxID=1951 RepID=UPI0037BC87AD